jgi:hypothetical protein
MHGLQKLLKRNVNVMGHWGQEVKAPKETATVGDEARNKAPEARTGNGKQKLAPAITTAIANLCQKSKQTNLQQQRVADFRYSCFVARLDIGFGV